MIELLPLLFYGETYILYYYNTIQNWNSLQDSLLSVYQLTVTGSGAHSHTSPKRIL
jgi:hypothetical protein